MRYQVIEATEAHAREMAVKIRQTERQEIIDMGVDPLTAILQTWAGSWSRKTVMIDGQLGAMFGCSGSLMSSVGNPWLLPTPLVERVPVSFLKVARDAMRGFLEVKSVLVSSTAEDYNTCRRFMKMVGFETGNVDYVGPSGRRYLELRMGR